MVTFLYNRELHGYVEYYIHFLLLTHGECEMKDSNKSSSFLTF
jgi:hypothetical protein